MRLLFVLCVWPVGVLAAAGWPDLSTPARAVGGGERDAAVIVGIEDYFAVPPVPGAKTTALLWYDYLTKTRGVPPENVSLLRDGDGTLEEMRAAAGKAAGRAGPKGSLWFVFVGHGAAAKDGKDGLLVGVDAQQKAESLQSRSLPQSKLLETLRASPARSIHVVLDACFSGRSPTGAALAPGLMPLVTTQLKPAGDPRLVVLSAARNDQFAGALPGASLPAFSYLALGGLRGWADADGDATVTAGEVLASVRRGLQATLRGREQTPSLIGSPSAVLGPSALESGPDLAEMAKLGPGSAESTPKRAAPAPRAPETDCDSRLSDLLYKLQQISFDEMLKIQGTEGRSRRCLPAFALELARPGREFINVMGLIGPPDDADLRAFVDRLQDKRTLVRQNSALALAQMRHRAKPALAPLMRLARGSSGEERQRHVRAVTMIAPTSDEMWRLLMELYRKGTEPEREYLEQHIAMAARNGNLDDASLGAIRNGARRHKDRRQDLYIETLLVVRPNAPETWETVWEFYEDPGARFAALDEFKRKHADEKSAHPADVMALLDRLKKR